MSEGARREARATIIIFEFRASCDARVCNYMYVSNAIPDITVNRI